MSTATEALRAELAAAADRETQADRAYREAYEELKRARAAYRTARRAYDDAAAAEEFARTHPALFADPSDCSGAWDGFCVVSDADPGL